MARISAAAGCKAAGGDKSNTKKKVACRQAAPAKPGHLTAFRGSHATPGAMPRLGLLLAALTPIRAWWERHAQDSSVLTLSVPAGDSFVRATQKLAEDCDLQESEAAIVDAFRGRYRFTLGDSDVAPYRMDLLVTSEHCHRQDISMSTASGWRHNFGALYFDGDDDVDALLRSSVLEYRHLELV